MRLEDLSGFSDPDTGLPFAPIGSQMSKPKAVWLDGDALHWKTDFEVIDPPAGLLWKFFGLAKAGPEVIEKFAQKYGILSLRGSVPVPYSSETGSPEPLQEWASWAESLGAIVQVAAALNDDRMPEPDNWQKLPRKVSAWPAEPRGIVQARQLFSHRLSLLSRAARISIAPYWDQDRWAIGVTHLGTLFGVLVLQILLATSQAKAILNCSGCAQLYLRSAKLPKAGQRNYCPACREAKISGIHAARDFRQRRSSE